MVAFLVGEITMIECRVQPSVRELAVGEDDEEVKVRGVSERASAHVASDAWQ